MPTPIPPPLAVRPALAAALVLALSACGTPRSAAVSPTVEIPAPPAVADPALPPRSEPAPPPAPEPRPAPPPPAPAGTVEARSVYPQDEGAVAEWTLSNGATVVYVFLPGAESAYAVVSAEGGAALVDAEAASVDAALALVREAPAPPDAVTAVVVGGEPPEAVENAVGRTLGGRWPVRPEVSEATAPPTGALRARVDLDDDGALLVLEDALRRRAGSAQIDLDTRAGTADLTLGGAGRSALGPLTRAEAEAARDAVVAVAARSPEAFAARALADLYRAPGARRPARPPSFALDRLRRVRAVSSEALSALAARFAASR